MAKIRFAMDMMEMCMRPVCMCPVALKSDVLSIKN